LSGAITSATTLLPRPSVPTMSRLSSGNCSSVCLRRSESGRGPLPLLRSVNALLNGSRSPWAAYSNVSNCCITGSGSSGGAGRALTSATKLSRLGASPGVLVTPREQPTSNTSTAEASIRRGIDAPPRTVSSRISGPLLAGLRRGRLGDFFLVEVAVGLRRARRFQRSVGRDADALAFATRLQRDVVHRHDHHPRQRGDAADEPAELVVVAHHAERDRLLGVELLGLLRTGL